MVRLYLPFLIVHIACIAVWFGGSLSIPGRIRRGLAAGAAEARFMAGEVSKALALSKMFGVATLVTGMLLIFAKGGFGSVPSTIHTGLTLTMIMVGLQYAVIGPTWKKLSAGIAAGEDSANLKPLRVRMVMMSGILQLLWVINLVLMLQHRGFNG